MRSFILAIILSGISLSAVAATPNWFRSYNTDTTMFDVDINNLRLIPENKVGFWVRESESARPIKAYHVVAGCDGPAQYMTDGFMAYGNGQIASTDPSLRTYTLIPGSIMDVLITRVCNARKVK
jgi:hypothetical protein